MVSLVSGTLAGSTYPHLRLCTLRDLCPRPCLTYVHNEVIRGCIQKCQDGVDNEINNNQHSLRSNTKGCGGKTH
jgi:hypothetical protein